MISEAPDPVMQRLAHLAPAEADASRNDRVRSRCHAVLARRRARDITNAPPMGYARRGIELSLVAGFCLLYLGVVIRHAWHVMG